MSEKEEKNEKNLEETEKTEKKADNVESAKSIENKPVSGSKKKKLKHQIQKGQAHIQCTYNNTLVTISDSNGQTLGWSSSGLLGFKGAKKATSYAATQVVGDLAEKVKKYGLVELEVFVKGVGGGREAAIRALANKGFNLISIKDVTPIPHNGCRPRKPRRV